MNTGSQRRLKIRGIATSSVHWIPFCSLFVAVAWTNGANGIEVEGFVEPYRSIEVAAPEPGILSECAVSEGDVVVEGQVLAKLEHDVQLALLAIGDKSKRFRGRLISAQAELELRKRRLASLTELLARGHAQNDEVERARADVDIAQGNLLAAQEELQLKQLECERIQAQIERRIIRAPLHGVVTEIRKQPGEFVPVNDPHVLTVVQLDSLLATFSVPSSLANTMNVDQDVRVRFPISNLIAAGRIDFVSPVDDAESGTVRIKVRIDNRRGQYRSGQHCALVIGEGGGLAAR